MRPIDLLIAGGTVVDGRGQSAYQADIAIRGEEIVDICPSSVADAEARIDAAGLMVAPGFVDIHSHSDYHLFLNPQADSSLLQGVTTEIGGNCGYSAAPILGPAKEERRRAYEESFNLDPDWSSLAEYFQALENVKPAVNFGILVGHNTIRSSLLGESKIKADPGRLESMAQLIREGISQGAFGLSTGLIYPPACFSDRQELIYLARQSAAKKGIFTVHLRNEGSQLISALKEALEVARASRVRLQISHLKTSGEENWPKLDEAFQLIEEAQADGVAVSCDRYPYTASNTGLQALLPNWALAGDPEKRLARLKQAGTRGKIIGQLNASHADNSYWKKIVIAEVGTKGNKALEGLTLAQVASLRGLNGGETLVQLLLEEELKITCLIHSMSETNLRRILQKPYVMVGSDSGCRSQSGPLAQGRVHPRIFGTFARVLGEYVREQAILDLPGAIRKMTYDPCQALNIPDRGLIKEGYKADLVIFDAARIRDTATYASPFSHPEGIHYVIVNGKLAVSRGKATGAKAGKVVKSKN